MHHQKNSRKKVPRVLSSESESSDSTNDLLKKSKKKRIVPLISSDESDTTFKDDDLNRQKSFKHFDSYPKVVDHDSDNSSVESMDKIMYPSTSVLLKIENSKKLNQNAETKDHDKNNLKGRSKNCSVKQITKSKVSKRQPKIEKTFNKSTKEFSKKKEIFNQHKHTKEIHSKVKNKNENLTIHRMNNKNVPDHKIFNHHEPKKKLQNNKVVMSKNKKENGNPFIHSMNNTNVIDSKISSYHEPNKEFQNNKLDLTKVNINDNTIPHTVNNQNVPKRKFSNDHKPKKDVQKNEGIITEVKNKNSIINSINSKNVPKGKISNQHQPKKEVQNNVIITGVKNDNRIIHSINNKSALHQNYLASNKEKLANYKIPALPPSKSDKNEKSIPNKCNESYKATCSDFQNKKSEFQIKHSTVKRRPLNYGSRMKQLLTDLESSLENKSPLFKHKNLTETKNINQLKVKGNEHEKRSDEKEISYQVATDNLGSSNEIIQCTIQQDSIFRNVKQSPTDSQPCNSVNSMRMYRSLIGDDYQLKLIKRIVDIDTKYLDERGKNSRPPPNLSEGAELLPLSFKSFDRYFCKHEPMLSLEIWEKIFEHNKTNLSLTNKNYFSFLVKDYKYLNGLMLLDCESEVNEHRTCILAKNNLVIVKLKQKNDLWSTTFGFIYELENTENIDFYKEDEFPYSQNYRKAPAKQFFKMFVKCLEMVSLNCFMDGKIICNLYKEMREMEGLYLMKSSPLMQDILNPRWDTFCTPYDKELCMKDFDTVRLHISDIVCTEIHSFPSQPKIILLEGPPGSCKTMCIANIAWRLSRCKDNKKILIVAPNRIALEEITAQLFNLNDMFNNDNLNLLKYYHLGLVEITPISETKIKEASIILTRPKDCCELDPFKNVLQFSCCLIDEVNQFTEPGILYPFSLDIKKFLLVGDKNELPPKLRSNITIDFGYQKSIMERFQDFFSKTYDKNPTIVLKQQFRMHHQIALFPFKNIYSNPSIKCTYASKRSAFHPLRRYVLFDYQCDLGTNELPHTGMMGIKIITSLLTHIIPKLDSSAIGIIVPSKEVQKEYQSVIKCFPDVKIGTIEIGTVEYFQGQEKPVIIISCFHDFQKDIPFNTNYFSDERRLNVALTRAISSLIICGPFHPLMKYDIWAAIISDSQERGDYYKIRSENDLQNSHFEKI